MTMPDEHILTHVREELAMDGRVGELGLEVSLDGDVVVIRGAVSTDARKAEVAPLATEVLRSRHCDYGVRDETEVTPVSGPHREAEQL